MDQQNFLRIGALDGKAAQIVGYEAIGGVDLDLAAAEAVRDFERGEVDGGASVCRNRNGLGRGGLAVHNQRHTALRGWGAVACDHCLHVKIGRASCRERVEVAVVGGSLKKEI